MGDAPRRGDHPYVDAKDGEHADDERLPNEVFVAELASINARRAQNNKEGYTAKSFHATGISLSGGGIRSASFCLGALQGLQSHQTFGMKDIDYLSTVSGGGYVGCALIAATQNLAGQFPFTSLDREVYADTPSVRHIRDYSNYLIPHGAWDAVTAFLIMARGLVANALIVLPVLLFCVGLTLFIHPDVESLGEPSFHNYNLAEIAAAWGVRGNPPLWGLHGFWLTSLLMGAAILFLAIWAIAKSVAVTRFWQTRIAWSWTVGHSAELDGGLITLSKVLFLMILGSVLFETQPFILRAMSQNPYTGGPKCGFWTFWASPVHCVTWVLGDWHNQLITRTPVALPIIGAVFAWFSKSFTDAITRTKNVTGWQARVTKIPAKAALWYAAIVIPLCLWIIYIRLTYAALGRHWTPWIFETSGVSLFLALLINPNVTSLYRLY
jgi:Patatin-like phospholipase